MHRLLIFYSSNGLLLVSIASLIFWHHAFKNNYKNPINSFPIIIHFSQVCYSIQDHSRHTLFCGTEVVQTRFYGNQKVLAHFSRLGKPGARSNGPVSLLTHNVSFFKQSLRKLAEG